MFNTILNDEPESKAKSMSAVERSIETLDDIQVAQLFRSNITADSDAGKVVAGKCVALLCARHQHATGMAMNTQQGIDRAWELVRLSNGME